MNPFSFTLCLLLKAVGSCSNFRSRRIPSLWRGQTGGGEPRRRLVAASPGAGVRGVPVRMARVVARAAQVVEPARTQVGAPGRTRL